MVKTEANIHIMSDITQTETLELNQNKKITLTSDETTNSIIRDNALTTYVINLSDGTLNLTNIDIDGNNVEAIGALVIVNGENANFNLNENATIKNGNNIEQEDSVNSGGGLRFAKGTIIIDGGNIINNKAKWGAGILSNVSSVTNTLIFNSGKISNNEGTFGGGYNGRIEMNGGEISYNKTTGNGGGGVITGKIKGGTISYNTSQTGAGITLVSRDLEITGGTISNNTATKGGGGIQIGTSGTLIMMGGIINNNTALTGGGIYIQSTANSATINGGTIKNNTGTSSNGGILTEDASKYLFQKGTICGNKPTNSYETSSTC